MRQWLLVVLALAAFALVFNTHLLSYGSLWCDQRVNQISAEKDKSVRQAIDQMHEALAQQDWRRGAAGRTCCVSCIA